MLFFFFCISLAYASADYSTTSYPARTPRRLARKLASPMTHSVKKNGRTRPKGRVLFLFFQTGSRRSFVASFASKRGRPCRLKRSTYVPLFFKKIGTLSALKVPYSVTLLTQKLRLNFAPYSVANRLNFSRCSPAQKVVK